MNKKQLIRLISRELELPISQEKVTMVLDKAIEITNRTLETGESVKWSGHWLSKKSFPKNFILPNWGNIS